MRRRKNTVNKNQIRSSNERCGNQFKVTQCHEMGEEEKEEEEEREEEDRVRKKMETFFGNMILNFIHISCYNLPTVLQQAEQGNGPEDVRILMPETCYMAKRNLQI